MSESKLKKTLDRYKKPELIDKLLKSILSQQEQKKDSDSIISKLEDKLKAVNKENKLLRAKSVEKLTDDKIMEEILALRAIGKSPSRIYENLNDNRGLDVELSVIKSVCENLDDLSEEMKNYYNKQKKLYFDNLSFNKENILLEDVLTISGMIESSRRALENMDSTLGDDEDFNFENYRKLQDHISKLIKEKNNVLKSINGDDSEEESENFDIGFVTEESEELDIEIIE